MTDVKIGVNAEADVSKAVGDITKSVNELAGAIATANKTPFKPVDVQTASKDIAILNKQFEIAIKQSKTLRDSLKATGQSGKQIQEVDFRKLSVDPAAAQRMRDKAFGYAARGTAWDMSGSVPAGAPPVVPPSIGGGGSGSSPPASGGGGNRPRGPGFFPRLGSSFAGGVGGGFGRVANGAISGGSSGAAGGGGMMGGIGGMLLGGAGAAALFGVFKAGQAVSEGYGMAKDRDINLDNLKRQMGDLAVSFVGLKAMSDIAAQGLGINSKEFVALAEQYNKISHNAEKDAPTMMGDVRSSVQFGRAYGLDPGMSANFFGGMKNIDPKQNNRELALQIAEAVNKSGGRAMADDVMRLVQSFAASNARLSLSAPNTGAYAAAFGSMMKSGSPGMTSDNAAAILGQANSALSGMGNAGEAGQNFIMGSLNGQGMMNPVLAKAQAASGLFGTRGSTFGADTELSKYLGKYGIDPSSNGTVTGANRDVTNFQSVRANLERQYKDPYMRLDGAQNLFGLSSPQQAAALLNLNPDQYSGLSKSVRRAGVNINDVNASGISTLANIGNAQTHSQLDSVYADIGKRTGVGSLSSDERKTLDAAQKGDTESFRDVLIKIMATKDQAETEGSKLRATLKDMETVQTTIGDKMIGPLNIMRDAMLKLAGVDGKSATASSLRKAAYDAEREDVNSGYDGQISAINSSVSDKTAALRGQQKKLMMQLMGSSPALSKEQESPERTALKQQIGALAAQIGKISKEGDADIAKINADRANNIASIGDREKADAATSALIEKVNNGGTVPVPAGAAAPAGKYDAQIMQESGGRHRNADGSLIRSPKGALGITQVMPKTGVDPGYGIEPLQGDSPEDYIRFRNSYMGVARKRYGGDEEKALASYNAGIGKTDQVINKYGDDWLKHMPKESQDYVSKIEAGDKKNLASDQGAQDTLNVNIKLDASSKNGQGSVVQHNMQTSVAVPRGSGVKNTDLAVQ